MNYLVKVLLTPPEGNIRRILPVHINLSECVGILIEEALTLGLECQKDVERTISIISTGADAQEALELIRRQEMFDPSTEQRDSTPTEALASIIVRAVFDAMDNVPVDDYLIWFSSIEERNHC